MSVVAVAALLTRSGVDAEVAQECEHHLRSLSPAGQRCVLTALSQLTARASGSPLASRKRPRPSVPGGVVGAAAMAGVSSEASAAPLVDDAPADLGESLMTLIEVTTSYPGQRGKCPLQLHQDYVVCSPRRKPALHISTTNIRRVFQFEHPVRQKKQVVTVVCLLQPQGKVEIVTLSVPSSGASGKVSLGDGVDLIDDGLEMHEQLLSMFKAILTQGACSKITTPAIPCHLKVSEGYLFLVRQGILFFGKSTFIPLSRCEEIAMSGSASRTFELHVRTNDGKELQFSTIDRVHEDDVRDHLSYVTKKMAKAGAKRVSPKKATLLDGSEEEDGAVAVEEDSSASGESDDDEFNPDDIDESSDGEVP